MRGLERGQLWVMRVHALVASLLFLGGGSAGDYVLHNEAGWPRGIVALPLLLVGLYAVLIAPSRRYRAWRYLMDADELQVRRGVWTEVHTVVPLDRVQHIDISQGPLERAFAVCRLIVHTAGTLNSQVVLPGLARGDAERMRDEIRGRIRQEAP